MGTCVFGCHGYVSPKYEPWRHQTCCTWYSDAVMTNGWPTAEVWWPDVMYLTVSYKQVEKHRREQLVVIMFSLIQRS